MSEEFTLQKAFNILRKNFLTMKQRRFEWESAQVERDALGILNYWNWIPPTRKRCKTAGLRKVQSVNCLTSMAAKEFPPRAQYFCDEKEGIRRSKTVEDYPAEEDTPLLVSSPIEIDISEVGID